MANVRLEPRIARPAVFDGARVALIVLLCCLLCCNAVRAASAQTGEWRADAALERQLDLPVSFRWSGTPLRGALTGLSRAQRVALLIDRRVDPGRLIDARFENVAFRAALAELAVDLDLGLSQLEALVYLGPQRTAHRLRTLVELRQAEVEALPKSLRSPLLAARPLVWDDFAEPRALVTELLAEAGVAGQNLEQIPHDLWCAGDLPPLAWPERLSLVLAQFDLTYEWLEPGRRLALCPMPQVVAIERRYPGGRDPAALAARWAEQWPEADIEVVDGGVRVTARVEDHAQLSATRRAAPRPARAEAGGSSSDDERHTMRVRGAPLERVLQAIGEQWQIEIELDRGSLRTAGIAADTPVALTVEDATQDELLAALLAPLGLAFQREGTQIRVFAAPR